MAKTKRELEAELEALKRAARDVVNSYVSAEKHAASDLPGNEKYPYAFGMLGSNVPALARAIGVEVPAQSFGKTTDERPTLAERRASRLVHEAMGGGFASLEDFT